MSTEIFLTVLTFIIVCSILLNSSALLAFYFKRRKLDFKDNVMISLAIADLFRSVLGYMMGTFTFAKHFKNYSKLILYIGGFFTTFLAFTSIAHITVLALDIYFIICKPFIAEILHLRRRNAFWICFVSWMFGLFWAVLPVTGLSEYDDNRFGSSIDWRLQTDSNKVYISFLFVSCYAAPIAIMAAMYFLTKRELCKMMTNARKHAASKSVMEKSVINSRRSVRKIVTIMVLSFFIAWTPYAIISIYEFFAPSSSDIRNEVEITILLCAKSSSMFNPIIYMVCYKDFRKQLKKVSRKSFLYCCHYNNNKRNRYGEFPETFALHTTAMHSEIACLSEGPDKYLFS